jgi:hypothetical protein
MFGATTHSTEASTCTPVPTSSGSRRPKASESGPTTSWPRASPSRVPVRVSCTVGDVVASSSVIVGSDGRYMSMVSGPSAISAPSTSTSRRRCTPGSAAGVRARTSGVTVTNRSRI